MILIITCSRLVTDIGQSNVNKDIVLFLQSLCHLSSKFHNRPIIFETITHITQQVFLPING